MRCFRCSEKIAAGDTAAAIVECETLVVVHFDCLNLNEAAVIPQDDVWVVS